MSDREPHNLCLAELYLKLEGCQTDEACLLHVADVKASWN